MESRRKFKVSRSKGKQQPRVEDVSDSLANLLEINAEKAEVAKLLECPVCYKIVLPPVTICINGHMICNHCKSNLQTCPICRGEMTNTRNRFAEEFLAMCTIPCKYWEDGCTVRLSGVELSKHYELCEFSPLACPICEIQLQPQNFLKHLETEPRLQPFNGSFVRSGFDFVFVGEHSTTESFDDDVYWIPCWLRAHGRDFFCFLNQIGSNWCIWASLFGKQEDCEQFTCTLSLLHRGQQGDLKYKGNVHPIRISKEEVVRTGECLLFTNATRMEYMFNGGIDIDIKIEVVKKSASNY